MFPPNFFLVLVLLSISLPAITSPSTVAISHIANITIVCAFLRRNSSDGYDLNCTGIPTRHQCTYMSAAISSSAISGGDGFLYFLSLSASVSTVIWWDLDDECYGGWPPDYKRVYRGTPIADLSAGDSHVCGIEDGILRRPACWRWKQLSFPEDLNLSDIAVGGDFVCGLLRGSKEIRCFGNDIGVVGHEPNGTYFTLAAGSRHACAVSWDGKLVCWGAGAPKVGATPFKISSLALGEDTTCALASNGTVACWGENSRLPCGLADTRFMAIQDKGSAICGILTANYSLACWGCDIFDSNPIVYDSILPGTCVPKSSCSCGVLSDSCTWCANGSGICRLCELEVAAKPRASPPLLPPPPPPSSPKKAGTPQRTTAFVVLGSVGVSIGLVTLCLCSLYFFRYNSRVHASGGTHGAEGRPLPPGVPSARAPPRGAESSHLSVERLFSSLLSKGRGPVLQEFPLSVLLAATDNFSESHKVGSGGFGSVYGATLDDGHVVVVKRAEASASTSNAAAAADKESAFLSELVLLSRVNHKNLVRLLGYCKQGAERVLVYEFVANGTLHDHLHRLPDAGLASWGARLRVALDAARGLEYLHAYTVPPIIHRDVKSSNILLDDTWTAKVSDFGLSLMNPVDAEDGPGCAGLVRAAGTVGYMDPEYYRLQYLTPKSDVYSFGVVLLELLTGCKAIHRYENSGTPKNVVEFAMPHLAADDVHRVLDARLPPPAPGEVEAVTCVAYLAIDCVNPEGQERPTMTEVVYWLERGVAACEAPTTRLSRSSTARSI